MPMIINCFHIILIQDIPEPIESGLDKSVAFDGTGPVEDDVDTLGSPL